MSDLEQNASWFLAQLKPNCAMIAEKNLNRQGFSTFIPLEEQTRERNGKFVTGLRPLFPGYIFVAIDVTRGLWRRVNATYGVARLVSFGTVPAMVPRGLISDLMLRCDAGGKLLPVEQLNPGDQVRLTAGPFASFVAEVQKMTPDHRVWVLMEIMGGQTRVAVSPEHLRRVGSCPASS